MKAFEATGRRFLRNATTGDLGELVERDGKKVVVYPGRKMEQPIIYKEHEWYDEATPRALTVLQCAEIAFAADQRLLYFLGDLPRSRKTWLSLSPEERTKFAEEGPHEPMERRLVWRLIMRGTEGLRKEGS